MKTRLKYSFSERTKELFIWNYMCFYCWKSGFDSFHHILRRRGKLSNSPLNCCPIHNNGGCHIGNSKLSKFKVRAKLLKDVFNYLREQKYVLTKKDRKFMEKYKEYYKYAECYQEDMSKMSK